MLEKFQEESHILLYDFLSDDVIDRIRELCCEDDRRHKVITSAAARPTLTP